MPQGGYRLAVRKQPPNEKQVSNTPTQRAKAHMHSHGWGAHVCVHGLNKVCDFSYFWSLTNAFWFIEPLSNSVAYI